MPEMSIAIPAQQFDPGHAEAVIRTLYDIGFFQFRVKTGPATTGVEFAAGIEQGMPAAYAVIMPLFPAPLVFTAERRLRSSLPRNPVLLRRQLFLPFPVGLAYFCHASILTK